MRDDRRWRSSSLSLLDPCRLEARTGVDVHHPRAVGLKGREAVDRAGRRDDHLACRGLDRPAVDREPRAAGLDDEGLDVRVVMQRRTAPGRRVDEDHRDVGAVVSAFEVVALHASETAAARETHRCGPERALRSAAQRARRARARGTLASVVPRGSATGPGTAPSGPPGMSNSPWCALVELDPRP